MSTMGDSESDVGRPGRHRRPSGEKQIVHQEPADELRLSIGLIRPVFDVFFLAVLRARSRGQFAPKEGCQGLVQRRLPKS